LRQLADESGEPEGWIFNIIESRAGTSEDQRTGARWYAGEKGRLVEIPVDFNLEPIDVTVALTEQHLQRIRKLEGRLAELEEERQEFHCPYCDAQLAEVHQQDYIEEHCIVTYEIFSCGYTTPHGFEEQPCPYGPNWPTLDEFAFVAEREKSALDGFGIVIKEENLRWVCWPTAKTPRVKRVHAQPGFGRTKEEAEEAAQKSSSAQREKEGVLVASRSSHRRNSIGSVVTLKRSFRGVLTVNGLLGNKKSGNSQFERRNDIREQT
jgi:hypothetical protein